MKKLWFSWEDFTKYDGFKETWSEKITTDLKIAAGRPVFRGTRVGVWFALDYFAFEAPLGKIARSLIRHYGKAFTKENLEAALAFASDILKAVAVKDKKMKKLVFSWKDFVEYGENKKIWEKKIAANPNIAVGKPVLCGSRVGVCFALGYISFEAPLSKIAKVLVRNYGKVFTKENLEAALTFAADVLRVIKLETVKR